MTTSRDLTRRERQLLDLVYLRGEATAASLEEALPDPPSNATIRSLLRGLEDKGFLKHRKDGRRFVYRSAKPMGRVKSSALRHLIRTLFGGSSSEAITAILRSSEFREGELDELAEMIERAREEER